jgi:hypothetical protein
MQQGYVLSSKSIEQFYFKYAEGLRDNSGSVSGFLQPVPGFQLNVFALKENCASEA